MDILRRYFYGLLTPDEEEQVQIWISEYGDDPEIIAMLETIMSELEVTDSELSSSAFNVVRNRLGIRSTHAWKIFRKIANIAAILILIISLPFAGFYISEYFEVDPVWEELDVPYGETKDLVLADGTVLHLNAGSRVTYPSFFEGSKRQIFVDGEVYADVVKNPEQPFVITSGDVDIKVYGTTFNFKSYKNSECVELFLLSGCLDVDLHSDRVCQEVTLEPGEVLQYNRSSGEVDLRHFNPIQYRGFHEGRSLHFFNLTFSDIVSDLERNFDSRIVILDESLAYKKYYAWFTNNETLEQILEALDIDKQMKYYRKDDVIYINKKK